MKIGIDIDDTVSYTNQMMVDEAIKFDEDYLNDRGFKDETAYSFREMFYWTSDDVEKFLKYIRGTNLLLKVPPIEEAAYYINKLKEEGNEIYFITKRNNTLHIKSITKKWFKQNGFKYNKIHYYIKEKAAFCKRHKIDILIDNDVRTAKECVELGLKYVLKQDGYNYKNMNYNMIDRWEDIYKYIKKEM